MNRKVLFCLLVNIYVLGNVMAFSQQKLKFSVASFGQDSFDTSAKDKQYEKIDGNGSHYAIIKVTSDNPEIK